jgi:peptidoglycan/xylan/chitin deacetylase (PgdA/CDA1 family)
MNGIPEAAGALSAAAGLLAYAVRGPSASLFAPSVHRGVPTRRAVALTFDDGPSESTPELLDVLAGYHSRATFFQCGVNVRRLPGVARQVAEGRHEIGNHSDTHPYFHFKSAEFILRELSDAQSSIESATGRRPRLFRPPFGVRWFGLRAAQRRLGLMGVMWTAIGVDWKGPEAEIVTRLVRRIGNGAIFCLHDGRRLAANPDIRTTVNAVRRLMPILIDKGFHFETVSEILCPTTSSSV